MRTTPVDHEIKVLVDAATYLCIGRQAVAEDRSKSSLVRIAIKQYLERQARDMANAGPLVVDHGQDMADREE